MKFNSSIVPPYVRKSPRVDTTAPVVPLRHRSREFPAHLPREVMGHKPQDCDCPECGGRLRKLGEDASEMLDYVPGYFHAAATDPTTRT